MNENIEHTHNSGIINTYTIVYVGFGHMADKVPYVLAIIEFPSKDKITAVIEDVTDFNSVKIGMSVALKRTDEKIGPVFQF